MQEFVGQCFIFLMFVTAFISIMVKRADKDGKGRRAAGRAAVRGGFSLFRHLTK